MRPKFAGVRNLTTLMLVLLPNIARSATPSESASWDLTVVRAMDLAETFAFSNRIAEQSVEENIARSRQTMASMAPSLSLESTQAWLSKDINKMVGKSTGSGTVPDRINTAALVVGQPIIALGPLYLKLKADFEAVEVARHEARQSRRTARFSGAEAFLKAVKADQFLTIADSSFKLVEKQRGDGEALFRAGKLTNVDLLRLDMALSDAKAQLAQARNLRELGLVSLAETVGAPDYKAITLKIDKASLFESKPIAPQNREEAIQTALQNRAEIKAAAARVQMAEYMSTAANFDYFPMINAFLKYERDFEVKDTTVPDLAALIRGSIAQAMAATSRTATQPSGAAISAGTSYKKEDIRDKLSYGLSLKWTLWDWGSRWFRSSEMAAGVHKARLAREQIESGIRLETTAAALDLEYALASLETSKSAVRVAEETYKQQNARFQSGSGTVTDIITAERDQTRARGGLINAQGDLDIAWLKFFRVTAQDLEKSQPKNP